MALAPMTPFTGFTVFSSITIEHPTVLLQPQHTPYLYSKPYHSTKELGGATHTWNLNIQEAATGGPQVQGQPENRVRS